MNPYWGKDFFGFLALLFSRSYHSLLGESTPLASDEVQLLVLGGVSIAAASVGVFLFLKRMTMLANSLSHTILLGIVLAYLVTFAHIGEVFLVDLKILMIGALIAAFVTSLFTQMLTHFMRLQEDASIGLVFSTLFALGVVLVTLYTRNTHIGAEAIMGNVDALHPDDIKLALFIAFFNLLPVFLLFKEFKMTTFDPGFSNTVGVSSRFFDYLLMLQTAATAIASFRAVGVLLFLALLVGPVLAARLWTKQLGKLLGLSLLFGVIASLVAVALSRHLLSVLHMPLSTSGLVVVSIAAIYLLSILLKGSMKIFFQRVLNRG